MSSDRNAVFYFLDTVHPAVYNKIIKRNGGVFMLHEVNFLSYNERDTVCAWIYVPAAKPKGIVQLIHGFGEHSRRYLHMISAFVDAGYIVAADDHVGHGKTAMENNHGETGATGAATR